MTGGARRAAWIAIVAVALGLRLLPSWSSVFAPGFVNLQDGDAWYHLRLIEYQVRHFPHRLLTDPYLADGGAQVAVAPFFDALVAALARTIGGPDASTWLIAAVAACVPPILALVAVVVTGWIGRVLFGTGSGILAAALVAVMPGHFLDRTRLGFVDHHALESALAMLTLWCFMEASRTSIRALMIGGDWSRQGVFALLAGLGWGAYLATWTSGALLSFILAAWVGVHAVVAALRSAGASPVPRVVGLASVVAAAVLLSAEPVTAWRFGPRALSVVIAGGAAVGVMVVQALGRRLRPAPRVVGVAATVVVVVAGAAGLVRFGDAVRILSVDVQRLLPGPAASTVGEVRPLLLLLGEPSLVPAWALFGAPFFLGVPGLAWLAWRVVQRARPDAALLLVFGTAVLIATFGQNRFGYYLVPVLALLTGWLCAAGLRVGRQADGATIGWRTLLPAGVIGAVVFAPLVQPAMATAGQSTGLSSAWRGALTFLRDATPDPFDGRAIVNTHHGVGGITERPEYTVLAWWDVGYPLIQVARRVPVAVPTQAGAGLVSWFLGATDPAQALRLLRASRSRYIVVSEDLLLLPVAAGSTRLQGRFESVMAWGPGVAGYYEPFLERDGSGALREVVLFHPRYYRSMAARLFLFGGRAVEPHDSTWVITWRMASGPDGRRGKEIVTSQGFASYAEAERFRRDLGEGSHALVGRDPTRSCVPLGPMPEFRPVFETDDAANRPSGRSSIRVYEFVDRLSVGR